MRFLRANAFEAVHASRFDAEKKRKGVKCILSCPLWLQTYVSIVNKSIVIDYRWYSNSIITNDVLLIFPQFFDRFNHRILYNLCIHGALDDLIKIHDLFEWSHEDVRSNGNRAFRLACGNGHLDVAKWLYTTFHLTGDDARSKNNQALKNTCAYGHIDVCNWLVATFGEYVKI